MRTRSLKQLSAVENVKTTINWLRTIRNIYMCKQPLHSGLIRGENRVHFAEICSMEIFSYGRGFKACFYFSCHACKTNLSEVQSLLVMFRIIHIRGCGFSTLNFCGCWCFKFLNFILFCLSKQFFKSFRFLIFFYYVNI